MSSRPISSNSTNVPYGLGSAPGLSSGETQAGPATGHHDAHQQNEQTHQNLDELDKTAAARSSNTHSSVQNGSKLPSSIVSQHSVTYNVGSGGSVSSAMSRGLSQGSTSSERVKEILRRRPSQTNALSGDPAQYYSKVSSQSDAEKSKGSQSSLPPAAAAQQRRDPLVTKNSSIDKALHEGKRAEATRHSRDWSKQLSTQKIPRTEEYSLKSDTRISDDQSSSLNKTPARENALKVKENYKDDSFATPTPRNFPPPGGWTPPVRMRGLDPEIKAALKDTKDAPAAFKSHAGGSKSRGPSTLWMSPVEKDGKKYSEEEVKARQPETQMKNFLWNRKEDLSVQYTTRHQGRNPNDLTQGPFMDIQNADGHGIRVARRDNPARDKPIAPEERVFIGLLEPKKNA